MCIRDSLWSKAGLMSEVRHDSAWWTNSQSLQTLLVVFCEGKKYFKDTALRIYELDNDDRKSLLAEYREWIMNDLDCVEVMMLPYEAYTDKLDPNFIDDTL